jgi:hypothetical protein
MSMVRTVEKLLSIEAKGSSYRVSKEGILKDVHILGYVSANGGEYTAEAMQAAASTYVDVEMYMNHDFEDVQRNNGASDKIAYILEAKYKEGAGLVGDIQFNTGHPYFEAVKWWVENRPDMLGLSHVAPTRREGTKIVEIGKPYSVDFVDKPATTKGMFAVATEGIISDTIKKDMVQHIWNALNTQYYTLAYPMNSSPLTQEEMAVKLVSLLKDASSELKGITTSKESIMDYTKLTLENLSENRKDLIQAIQKEAVEAHLAIEAKVTEAVKDLDAVANTEVFRTVVRESVVAGKDVTALVADRKAVTTVIRSEGLGSKQTKEETPAPKTAFDVVSFETTLLGKK